MIEQLINLLVKCLPEDESLTFDAVVDSIDDDDDDSEPIDVGEHLHRDLEE